MEAVTQNLILELNSPDRLKILINPKRKMRPRSFLWKRCFDQKQTSICFLGLGVSWFANTFLSSTSEAVWWHFRSGHICFPLCGTVTHSFLPAGGKESFSSTYCVHSVASGNVKIWPQRWALSTLTQTRDHRVTGSLSIIFVSIGSRPSGKIPLQLAIKSDRASGFDGPRELSFPYSSYS